MRLLWQQIPDETVSHILSKNNKFDGVVLDTEHGVFNQEKIVSCMTAIKGNDKKCLVRVTEANKTFVRHYLDLGVDGLIFSTIELSTGYAREVLDQCQFPKNGRRGYGLTRDSFWGEEERKERPILIGQIESKTMVNSLKAVESLEPITFDYYLIGPYDLSSDLGDPANFDSDVYKNCIKEIRSIVPDSRLGYHIVKDIEAQYEGLKDFGIVAVSLDTLILIDAVKSLQEMVCE